MQYDTWSQEDLLALDHNDHEYGFRVYLQSTQGIPGPGNSLAKYRVGLRAKYLFFWVAPQPGDVILECGSSSGKTCVDFAKKSGCTMIGVDFDKEAVTISTRLTQEYFPELGSRCQYVCDDLTTMTFDSKITKILMPDFTEHIPDNVFSSVLANIKEQLPEVLVYIFTPVRTQIFEVMKHNGILLKNPSGHINVKTEQAMLDFLKKEGWEIVSADCEPSYILGYRYVESVLGRVPGVGKLFHKKMAIVARPRKA